MKKWIELFIAENVNGKCGRLGYFMSYLPLLLARLLVPLLLNPIEFYGGGEGIFGLVIIVMAIIITVVSTIILGPFFIVMLLLQMFNGKIDGVVAIVMITFGIPILFVGIKRCHDMGHGGWWQFIPLYSVWMLFAPEKDR